MILKFRKRMQQRAYLRTSACVNARIGTELADQVCLLTCRDGRIVCTRADFESRSIEHLRRSGCRAELGEQNEVAAGARTKSSFDHLSGVKSCESVGELSNGDAAQRGALALAIGRERRFALLAFEVSQDGKQGLPLKRRCVERAYEKAGVKHLQPGGGLQSPTLKAAKLESSTLRDVQQRLLPTSWWDASLNRLGNLSSEMSPVSTDMV